MRISVFFATHEEISNKIKSEQFNFLKFLSMELNKKHQSYQNKIHL